MKRLHTFIIKSYIGPLVLTFFISMFILLMQFLWKYIDDLVGKGLEGTIIAELLGYATFGLIPMALPLAILLSSIMTFGNLGENYELTALKASGISLLRVMHPLIILTVIISISAFFFSNNVLPLTNLKTAALLYDIRNQRPELNIKEGIFNNDLENYTLRAGRKDPKTNMMYNFMIYDHTKNKGNTTVTIADSAFMYVTDDKKYLVVHLYNGKGYEEVRQNNKNRIGDYPHRQSRFDEQRLIFDMSGFELNRTDDALFKHHYQMLGLKGLSHAEDSLIKAYKHRQKNFAENLLKNNFFRVEVKMNELDTIMQAKERQLQKEIPDKTISIDSIFNKFEDNKRENILNVASNYASSTKSYINNTKEDFRGRLKWIRRHQIEWHKKFTLSFACFIFFFIGAPLGAIIRRGGLGMPVVVSVVFFIMYYIITLTGEKFARESVIPTFEGMWAASVILLILGIFLTYKAARDSSIMDINYYTSRIKILYNKISGKNAEL